MAIGGNSFEVNPETEKFLCERLLDQTQPISERFRVLFSHRHYTIVSTKLHTVPQVCLFIFIFFVKLGEIMKGQIFDWKVNDETALTVLEFQLVIVFQYYTDETSR